jgi:Spy/CpxP family protein refolding chaperone
MHPAFIFWRHARRGHCETEGGPGASCGPGFQGGFRGGGRFTAGRGHGPGGDDGGGFGVRRPLRFLAHKLDLSEEQVGDLAKILNELKTERAQAEVDHQRAVSAFADAVEGDTFDAARAAEGAGVREASNARVKDAILKALSRIHGVLTKEQRQKFAYFVRTGVLSM